MPKDDNKGVGYKAVRFKKVGQKRVCWIEFSAFFVSLFFGSVQGGGVKSFKKKILIGPSIVSRVKDAQRYCRCAFHSLISREKAAAVNSLRWEYM